MTDSNSSVDISPHDYRKKRKSVRKSKSKSDSCLADNDYYTTPKNIQMSDEMIEKLSDLPDVQRYIEKLQKMIQKQVKKIIKWKMKARGNTEVILLLNFFIVFCSKLLVSRKCVRILAHRPVRRLRPSILKKKLKNVLKLLV